MKTTTRQLDQICREETGFASFADLLNAKGSYRPSIDQSNARLVILADAFDLHMIQIDDERRAYRYGKTGLNVEKITRTELVDAIRDAKNEASRTEDGGKVVAAGTWQIDAVDAKGERLDTMVHDGDGIPSLKMIRKALSHEGVASVFIQGETYFLDTSLPIADQWEYKENTGEGWAVELHS
jgi:hypothetical protein